MKFKDILKLGAGIIGTANPAVGGAIALVNQFLPDEKKLPESASVGQVEESFATLPTEVQQTIQESEIKLKIVESNNWVEVQRALADVDKAGSSTRPEIAKLMAYAVFLSIMPISCALTYAIVAGNFEIVREIGQAYPVVLALIGTPTALLNSYFGKRTKEKEARVQAASGQPVNSSGAGIIGLVTGLMGKK